MRNQSEIGDLAETAFTYEAQERDLVILEPRGNRNKYDVVVDSHGKFSRIQIKATETPKYRKNGEAAYQVNTTGNRRNYKNAKYSVTDVDFIAATIRPLKLWYIIPIERCAGLYTINLYGHRTDGDAIECDNYYQYEEYLGAWDLLK